MNRRTILLVVFAAVVLGCCVLSLYQTSSAAPAGGVPPFANSVEQRLETVQELREIKELLKEQNALLRSGQVKVIVTELPKAGETSPPAEAAGEP